MRVLWTTSRSCDQQILRQLRHTRAGGRTACTRASSFVLWPVRGAASNFWGVLLQLRVSGPCSAWLSSTSSTSSAISRSATQPPTPDNSTLITTATIATDACVSNLDFSCGNTAIKGRSWPNFWTNVAPFSPATVIEQYENLRMGCRSKARAFNTVVFCSHFLSRGWRLSSSKACSGKLLSCSRWESKGRVYTPSLLHTQHTQGV